MIYQEIINFFQGFIMSYFLRSKSSREIGIRNDRILIPLQHIYFLQSTGTLGPLNDGFPNPFFDPFLGILFASFTQKGKKLKTCHLAFPKCSHTIFQK